MSRWPNAKKHSHNSKCERESMQGRIASFTTGCFCPQISQSVLRKRPHRSSCKVDLCPKTLCWSAGLCLAELAPDGGPLYSAVKEDNVKTPARKRSTPDFTKHRGSSLWRPLGWKPRFTTDPDGARLTRSECSAGSRTRESVHVEGH